MLHPEEAAFQAALDAVPDDHTTRLVFADWLQERGDPRAEGYRMLGRLGVFPQCHGDGDWWYWYRLHHDHSLPCAEWWKTYRELLNCSIYALVPRRQAEDTAARAFAKLPRERRAESLTPAVPASG